MKKRIISMFLAAVICLSLMANALAAKVGAFSDVSDTAWYAAAVEYAYENGLFSGTSASTFSPSNSMTRGMFATVLSRISGVDKNQMDGEQRFADVDVSAYYGPSVTWAYENGIVSGVNATTFSPNSPITREQIAVMLYRYLTGLKVEVPKSNQTVSSFADAKSVSSYAKEAVNAMREWGFVAGDNNGNYNPRNYITRAEAATILMRVHYLLENGVPYISNSASTDTHEDSANIRVGKTVQLHADVTPSSASKDVTWSSSDTHVATVDSNGIVTGVSIGTARITARTSDGRSDVCELTVTGIIPQGITVAKKNVSLPIGNMYKLACFITPSSAKNDGFSYSSSNPSVASVAADGTVTAKAAGTAVITVKTMNPASKASAAVTITVSPDAVSVTSVALDQHDLRLSVKGTAQLAATVSPSNATDKSIMWSSDNTAVATVDSKGLVTAKSAGRAKITAFAGGKSDVCLVTVAGETQATSFSTTTPSFNIATSAYGDTLQQEVGVIKFIDKELGLNDGRYMADFANIGFEYTFVSSDPSVIKVNQRGGLYDPIQLKSGDAPRTATITVTREKDGATLQVDVTVSFNDKWMPIDDNYMSRFAASVFKTVNQYRADAGMQQMTYMYGAQDLANYRCEELAKEFSHARPDNGKDLVFTDTDGTQIALSMENIGCIKINYSNGATTNDPEALGVSAAKNWYDSPGHRNTLMRAHNTRTVVGLYVDTDGTAYMVQFFTSL